VYLHKITTRVFKIKEKLSFIPLLIARISIGFFFTVSGFNKLFIISNKQAMLNTMISSGIPFPEFHAIFVAILEFVFGFTLMVGLGTSISALVLMGIMVVAILVEAIHKIPTGLDIINWLNWFFYLPEVLYVIILFLIFITGSGRYGLDNLLCKNYQKICQFFKLQ
jgi:putative oxidoreductase